ncbi:MAG: carbohydrate kinase family protein, partial [Patescibacteria group bacterium]
MYDIITFGSASQDIYFASKKFLPAYGKKFITGEGVCLNLGSKTEMESVFFSSGGGGTNAAATFAKLGLKVAYCGQVGQDYFGNSILKELKDLKIDARLVKQTSKKPTNTSVILDYPGKDRTILVYRGASDFLEKKEIPWDKLKNTKWFYLAPFSGKLASATEAFISFAKKNKI